MPDLKDLTKEAKARLADCRRQKDAVALDIREAYFFTRPRLYRQVRSDTKPSTSVESDAHELVTGVGTEVAEDFATEVINAFFPQNFNWCVSKAAGGVPPEAWKQMEDEADKRDVAVFQELRASNFDAELASALVPDAGIGTVGLWIEEGNRSDPIRCQHVPIRELEINIGPYGDVDDRFAVRDFRYRNLPSVLPGVELPKQIADKVTKKPEEWVKVTWGFWRDWSEPRDVVWRAVTMVGDTVVATRQLRGEGCCPLLVMRFSPDGLHAFGNGPTIDALPDLRVLDELTEAQQNRASTSLRPPFAFPDDGVMNFENGIEDGHAYPKRPGQPNEIEPLFFQGDVDLGLFTMQDVEHRVRRKHFADYPEQAGKTPPTATQWVDEMAKAQRRIGTPGLRFFHEGPAQVFKRFVYLGERRGSVPKLQIGGKAVSTQPSNPATKAQEQQEVMVAVRFVEILNQFFPTIAQGVVDQYETAENIKSKLGDKLVVLRSQDEAGQLIQGLIQQMPSLMNAANGEAPEAGQ